MRHTKQRAQRFLLQQLYFHIALWRNGSLLAGSLCNMLISLPLLLCHGVKLCSSGLGDLVLWSKKFNLELAETPT